MRNVNGFRQQGDRPEMHKKDYQRCRCAETVEITLTTVSSARIRRYHEPEIFCLQQNIGASIRGPNYFLNTHTLVSGRAHDTTWDKDKNCFVGQNKSKICFNEHADSYLPKTKQNLVLSNQHAVLRYQPNKKTKLRSLQSSSWLSSIRKLLTSTPKATTQEQGKS